MMNKFRRLSYLVMFFVQNYYRGTRLILEVILLALYAGIIFDRRFGPYTYENVIIGKEIFLILIGVLVSFRLSRRQYTGQFSVILSRVSRKGAFLASILSCFLLTAGLGLILDLYFLAAISVPWSTLFSLPALFVSFVTILLTVAVVHIGSIYVVSEQILRVLLPIAVLLGAIPNWYNGLPMEKVFHTLSYLLPPLAQGVGPLSKGAFSYIVLIYPLIYTTAALWLGVKLFEKRSLTDLYY